MESSENKARASLSLLEKALGTLKEVLGRSPEDDVVRDAAIQRFEYVFELSWKSIQAAAQYLGKPLNTPRDSIRFAFKEGWVTDGEFWMDALDSRNKSSHVYNQAMAAEVFEFVKKFPPAVDQLIFSIRKVEGLS
jgi:nucleotidyltransferase substrate binding protein (TIGR01987 family)